MAGGRPTKYKPEMCETVIECGKEGMSKCEMALQLGIRYSTFNAWEHEKPEFSEAVKEAERFSQAWWERVGRLATIGQVDGFNSTAFIFNMKNRFKEDWRDKHEVEQSGDLNVNVQSITRELVKP